MYAAQVIPPIDAEIAEKGHFWMETNRGGNLYVAIRRGRRENKRSAKTES